MGKENTINTYPNPWEFGNEDKGLVSSDGRHKIEYLKLGEIVMGAPLAGYCAWTNAEGERIVLQGRFGGPAIWNSKGTKLALPTWTSTFFRGTIQQISILDVEKRELIRYRRSFYVLDLRTFHENEICGYNSPMYNTKVVQFDMSKERIAKRLKI